MIEIAPENLLVDAVESIDGLFQGSGVKLALVNNRLEPLFRR